MEENRINSIYKTIRKKIIDDNFYPGQKLSENTLAKAFSCSRTPIREILKRLENEGLVIIKPKSGTYVQHETTKDYINLLQVRTYLECLAYILAVKNISDKEINTLEKIVKEMDKIFLNKPLNTRKFAERHFDFHYNLVISSGNDLLIQLFNRLNLKASHMFKETMDYEGIRKTQDEHFEIVRLLKEKQPKGEKLIKKHLWRKVEYLWVKGKK
jgi:DNA-binding GntR family transcriptional regulator